MVAIVNIDPNLRESGEHLYSIRINHTEVAQCRHYREDSLYELFRAAALAVMTDDDRAANNDE